MSEKPTEVILQNPFTRVLTDEERALAPIDPNPNRDRQVYLKKPEPPEARERLLKKIDHEIRETALRAVRSIGAYAAVRTNAPRPEWMTDEDEVVAKDASLPDKEVPFALKAQLRIFESYQKQNDDSERKPLSVTINLYGDVNTQHNYATLDVKE